MKHCKRIAGIEVSSSSSESKRRRIVRLPETETLITPSSITELGDRSSSENFPVNAASGFVSGYSCSSFCTDQLPASCCSSNASGDVLKDSLILVDLEAKSFETVDSVNIGSKFRRETTPTSDLYGDSDELHSTATKNQRKDHQPSMPPEAEIEDFFAEAEKLEQKRFAEKYNFDIVKDVPLEGRYQWVRLKP